MVSLMSALVLMLSPSSSCFLLLRRRELPFWADDVLMVSPVGDRWVMWFHWSAGKVPQKFLTSEDSFSFLLSLFWGEVAL